MSTTDDTCPKCRGLKRIPASGGTSVKNGVLVHDLVHRERRCPTCNGTGKRRGEREYWAGKHPAENVS